METVWCNWRWLLACRNFWNSQNFGINISFNCKIKIFNEFLHFLLVVKSGHKIVGIYMMNKRSILIRDAQLARQIMTSDFASFHDRGVYVDEDKDPLSANLFNLRGASWRNLRHKLTPSFSSGKIKGMFGTIDDVGDKLVQHLEGVLDQSDEVEIKDVMTTYAVDIIGSVIFGLEIDSFSNPKNEFREISSSTYKDNSLLLKIHNMSMFICPP